jgi:hypothetical protein
MTTGDDEVSLDKKLARQARDEAEQHRKAAEKDLAEAQYLRAQAARDRAEIAVIEQSVTRREEALRTAGEPDFIRREQEAKQALADARQLMAEYSNTKHEAAAALVAINQREATAAARREAS